jgi:N6-L-threonylcarbamoyladenine synthase
MPGSGLILGIETSCDETAAAVVERGARTLSSVVASQITTHARYGGVVPELASREHLRAIVPVVRAALAEARVTLADLDAIAVTSGPGLAGALLVGITYAKALAFANNLPLIAVNHLEGHIHAVLLQERESAQAESNSISQAMADAAQNADPAQNMGAPGPSRLGTWDSTHLNPESALALVVSGGHTHLFLARPANPPTAPGPTPSSAAPSTTPPAKPSTKSPSFSASATPAVPGSTRSLHTAIRTPSPLHLLNSNQRPTWPVRPPRAPKAAKTSPIARLDPHFLFSFSGIKTAVLRYVELHGLRAESKARVSRVLANFHPPQTREDALALCPQPTLDLIASFQHAVVGDLMKKTFAAAESLGAKRILVTGGVAANHELRARFTAEAEQRGLRIAFPTLALSTDNAAMIAAAAWPRFLAQDFAPRELTADPSLALS